MKQTKLKEKNDKNFISTFIDSYKKTSYIIKNIGKKGIITLLLVSFITLWDAFFFSFEPLFAQKFSGYFLSETIIGGLLLATYILPIITLEVPFGKFEDKVGREKFILIGFLLAGISIYGLSIFSNIYLIFVSVILASTGMFSIAIPAIEGIYESEMTRKFGIIENNNSVGILELFSNIGYFLGPLIGGYLLSIYGDFGQAFKIFSLLTIIISVIIYFLTKTVFTNEIPQK